MNPDLQDLIGRVERAEGPDRWIDRDLAETFYPETLTRERRVIADERFSWMHPEYGLVRCEPYTSSLDSALALVERVRPDRATGEGLHWEWEVKRGYRGKFHAVLRSPWEDEPRYRHFRSDDLPTPALAVVLALLKSLQVREVEP